MAKNFNTQVEGFDGLPRAVDLAVGQTSTFAVVVPARARAQIETFSANGDLSPMRVFISNQAGVADASNLRPVGKSARRLSMVEGSFDSACVANGVEGATVNLLIDGTSPAKAVFDMHGSHLEWHCKAGDTVYVMVQPKNSQGEDYKHLPVDAACEMTPNPIN